MGTVNPATVSDGETIDASDLNNPINTLADEINGNLDSDNLADDAVATAKIQDDAVTDAKLDYPRWWQEIGRTTLGSDSDTIEVSSLPARKYLLVIYSLEDTGGTITAHTRFNSDSAANYAQRVNTNGTFTSSTSDASLFPYHGASAAPMAVKMSIENDSSKEKLVHAVQTSRGSSGGSSSVNFRDMWGKWANTSDQIDTITVTNQGTGSFAAGSEVIVLGHD